MKPHRDSMCATFYTSMATDNQKKERERENNSTTTYRQVIQSYSYCNTSKNNLVIDVAENRNTRIHVHTKCGFGLLCSLKMCL